MASFATFFVGGMHLRFSPLNLVAVWLLVVLSVAWTWTQVVEKGQRRRWLERLENENDLIYRDRRQLLRAFEAWQKAGPTEKRLFDEVIHRNERLIIAAVDKAMEDEEGEPLVLAVLDAFRNDPDMVSKLSR